MDKKYTATHPWLTFLIDTRMADNVFWMLLGEAQSKCKHVAGVLLSPDTVQKLKMIYLAKGAHATTAIEGNTLSEEQVQKICEGTLELPKSKAYLANEVDNIIEAYNHIANSELTGKASELCVNEIKLLNKMVLKGLPLEEGVIPGEIRRINVGVNNYRGAPPEDCEFLLKKTCEMITNSIDLGEGWEIASAILKAIVAHLYIAWIHPFGDGNGRTARLVEFKISIASGIPDIAAHLLSNHYNETRSEYYRALDATSKKKNPFPFIKYALQGYVDQLNEEIARIRSIQDQIFWINYVHTKFQGLESKVDIRRRQLIVDISTRSFEGAQWIKISDVRLISPRMAEKYAKINSRAISRDLNELLSMGLLVKKGDLVTPNIGLLSAYVPKSA